MQHWLLLFASILAFLIPNRQDASTPSPASAPVQVAITSPHGGQALQGLVMITGTTDIEGFQAAEITFSYMNNPTDTWFLISQSNTPVSNGLLAQWDTTTITDGVYALRLTVRGAGDKQFSSVVLGVRVRNYSLVETDTPTPIPPTVTPVPQSTSAPVITPSPATTALPTVTATVTPFPSNPAGLSRVDVLLSIGQGALAVIGFFALMGLYRALRSSMRRK